MGRHIIRLSRWSTRSVYLVYSRLITMIFALFCSVTGQVQRSASSSASTTFKGTAYRASDSTVLKNIQLYLQNCIMVRYGIMPDYGVISPEYGVSAWYGVSTTPLPVRTDENGQFEIKLTTSGDVSGSISSDDVVEPAGKVKYYSSGCLTIKAGIDTTYTLYLQKQTTAITPAQVDMQHQFTVTAVQGKDFRFQIPDWKGQTISAVILNSSGQKITCLDTDAEGMLCWSTRSVAGGVYFLQLQNGNNILSMKILVK